MLVCPAYLLCVFNWLLLTLSLWQSCEKQTAQLFPRQKLTILTLYVRENQMCLHTLVAHTIWVCFKSFLSQIETGHSLRINVC